MKRMICMLVCSCSLLAIDNQYIQDQTIQGLEYYIKPNGIIVYRKCGARVPERKESEEPQVLNPEFLNECPISKKEPKEPIAQEDQLKNENENQSSASEFKKRQEERKSLEISKREERIYRQNPHLKF